MFIWDTSDPGPQSGLDQGEQRVEPCSLSDELRTFHYFGILLQWGFWGVFFPFNTLLGFFPVQKRNIFKISKLFAGC